MLCPKCFEVDEHLFDTVQVVIRNPLTPHDDVTASVHTRPRASSYKLAPLYSGRLMEVVSSAVSLEDKTQTFFRLRSGGWINAAHVVCVMNADGFITSLSMIHLQGSRAMQQNEVVAVRVPTADVLAYISESMRLMEENPPYGIVMTALSLYPVLSALAVPPSAEEGTEAEAVHHVDDEEDPDAAAAAERAQQQQQQQHSSLSVSLTSAQETLAVEVVRFVHYVEHFILSELELSLDNEEPVEDGTMLSLYVDVLAGCVLAAQDLSQQWRISLPVEFVALTVRCITLFGRVVTLLNVEGSPIDPMRLRGPAVINSHVDLPTERQRIRELCKCMADIGCRLLQRGLSQHSLSWKDLQPLREQLLFTSHEVLQKSFCELTTTAMESSAVLQRHFLDADPLEVVVRLAKTASAAESQITAFRTIAVAARQCARNIALMHSLVLPALLMMAKTPRSPAAMTAALNCFFELAYNDPRVEPCEAAHPHTATPARGHSRAAAFGGNSSSSADCGGGCATCTALLHPGSAPFQLMYTFSLPNGSLVALCEACAARHRPSASALVAEPAFAYSACQCTQCRHESFPHPLSPPTVPSTSAISALQAGGLMKLLVQSLKAYPDNVAIANAVGRLTQRVQVPEEVIVALFYTVVEQPDLTPYAEAALALGAHVFLPCFAELLAKYADTPLARYIEEPYYNATPVKGGGLRRDETPAGSHMKSELGLSPSPDGSTAYRSTISEYRQPVLYTSGHPVVDLFASTTISTGGIA